MCLKIDILKYIVSRRAKLGQIQGGVAEGQPSFDKEGGGCNNGLLLRFKNITFWSFYAKRLKRAHI